MICIELVYTSSMQIIEPRLKISLFSRLMLYVDLPIVLNWEQTWTATNAYRNADLIYAGQPNDDSIVYTNGVPASTRTPSALGVRVEAGTPLV